MEKTLTKLKMETDICRLGLADEKGMVNKPVYRASTILFDSIEEMHAVEKNRYAGNQLYYGRYGNPSIHGLAETLAVLDGGDLAVLYPSGIAAIAGVLLTLLKSGDHMLMTEAAYPNSKNFAENILKPMGIETGYYDPLDLQALEKAIKPNTKVVFLESPGSSTMEFQDVPAIAKLAKSRGLKTVLDNTWATPLRFRPLEHGIDVAVQSVTKYIAGHGDLMMGVAAAKNPLAQQINRIAIIAGYCVSPDDCFMAMRGLRTMAVRMNHSEASAKKIAAWLKQRPEVQAVLHPEFDCLGKDIFTRDFKGGNGVFCIILQSRFSEANVTAFIESLELFGLGFSWGGFESLALPQSPTRTYCRLPKGQIVRFNIGLEDPDDLIADLGQAIARLT